MNELGRWLNRTGEFGPVISKSAKEFKNTFYESTGLSAMKRIFLPRRMAFSFSRK